MTEWLERNGFIPIPTQPLTDDEIKVSKSILGGTGMTNDEAIGVLEDVRDAICENIPGNHPEIDELREAVQMAASSLHERKKGKWLETDSHEPCWFKCDQCGRLSDIKEIYCPTCGASMANTTCGADMRETP